MAILLITGASGFVGRPACLAFRDLGYLVRAFTRTPCHWPSGIQSFTASALSEMKASSSVFDGVDCILHLAGRAHVMQESESDPLSAFRSVNVSETINFARQAALAGVRRFVFVSSIKVNGEVTLPHSPFTESDAVNPVDPYAISKHEAELGLLRISAETGMEVVIVRPPLIYGPGVKGNFNLMMRLLSRKTLLPLGSITDNKRSLIALDNLINFLSFCISSHQAAGRVFLVSDQQDVSTTELLILLSQSMGLSARLIPVPKKLLFGAASLVGKQSVYQRLCGSLVIDSSSASRLLGWTPPFSIEEGLRRASSDFLA